MLHFTSQSFGDMKVNYSRIYTNRVITKWELQSDLSNMLVAMETNSILLWAYTVDGFLQPLHQPQARTHCYDLKTETIYSFYSSPHRQGDSSVAASLPPDLFLLSQRSWTPQKVGHILAASFRSAQFFN